MRLVSIAPPSSLHRTSYLSKTVGSLYLMLLGTERTHTRTHSHTAPVSQAERKLLFQALHVKRSGHDI